MGAFVSRLVRPDRCRRLLCRAALVFLAVSAPGQASAHPLENGVDPDTAACDNGISLSDFAAEHQLHLTNQNGEGVMLERGSLRLMLIPDSRQAQLQHVRIWLQQPLQRVQDSWALARTDAREVLAPLLRPYRHVPSRPVQSVVLDPGHGGADSGAIGPGGLLEKDVALDLARRVRARLEAGGVRVHLTRDDDRTLSLDERVRMAADVRADVFVSIHLNGWTKSHVQGIETYVLSKAGYPSTNSGTMEPSTRHLARDGNRHDGANMVLGFALQRRMLEQTSAVDRGLRHARFQVLRAAPCPAALVECGFLTHPEESARLRDPAHLDRLADALASGILDFARETDRARLVEW